MGFQFVAIVGISGRPSSSMVRYFAPNSVRSMKFHASLFGVKANVAPRLVEHPAARIDVGRSGQVLETVQELQLKLATW